MAAVGAVIFDLGGTLVHWPNWDEDSPRRWAQAYDYVDAQHAGVAHRLPPSREAFVGAMRAAELAHWVKVETEHWSGPPKNLVLEGFRRLGVTADETTLATVLDGYARAVDGWAVAFPDARDTLHELRSRGYRIGLLSNTWWAAAWHNADLAAHGLADLIDNVTYTSDLPHSKPHPFVFQEVATRLGIPPSACVMVGDRMVDDVSGALRAGMRAIWRANQSPWPKPEDVRPTASISELAELPELLRRWEARRA